MGRSEVPPADLGPSPCRFGLGNGDRRPATRGLPASRPGGRAAVARKLAPALPRNRRGLVYGARCGDRAAPSRERRRGSSASPPRDDRRRRRAVRKWWSTGSGTGSMPSEILFARGNRTERHRAGTVTRPGEVVGRPLRRDRVFQSPRRRLGGCPTGVGRREEPGVVSFLCAECATQPRSRPRRMPSGGQPRGGATGDRPSTGFS